MNQKTDWNELKIKYLGDTLTPKEFAEQNSISIYALKNRIMKDNWDIKREELRYNALQRAEKKTENEIVNKYENMIKIFKGAEFVGSKILKRALESDINDLSATELRAVVSAMKECLLSQRLIHGESTENVSNEQNIHMELVRIIKICNEK